MPAFAAAHAFCSILGHCQSYRPAFPQTRYCSRHCDLGGGLRHLVLGDDDPRTFAFPSAELSGAARKGIEGLRQSATEPRMALTTRFDRTASAKSPSTRAQ